MALSPLENHVSAFLPSASLISRILFTSITLYSSTFLYAFIRNIYNSRKTGFPCIIVPWDQNHILWMILSVPVRPWLKAHLPKFIYSRLALTIYGWEFQERLRPFRRVNAASGSKSDDKMSFNLLTCGRFEFWTADPELGTEILKRPNDFLQPPFNALFIGAFGPNAITVDGLVWARHRKVVASVINERISKVTFQESLKQTDGMLSELFPEPDKDRAETTRLFDMMKKITIHVLSGAGMGISAPWTDDSNEKPRPGFRLTYIQAVKVIIEGIAGPNVLPKWFLACYPRFFPGGPFLKDIAIARQEYPANTHIMLDAERARAAASGGELKANIMSQLIAASEGSRSKDSQASSKNRALSDEELMGNLFLFTAAGFDTTANTLSYALVLLARYPQWQAWLCEEIDAIVPTQGKEWDYASIYPKANRIHALMLETLRLFPALVHVFKCSVAEQTLTSKHGTFWLPANTNVFFNTVALHLNPTVWRDLNQPPPDSKAPVPGTSPFEHLDGKGDETLFRPTRWINPSPSDSALFQPPRGTYVPWSAGPRVCPGQKMAQVEFAAIMLRMLSTCRLEAVALEWETREDIDRRLDGYLTDGISVLTLQMNGIYDMGNGKDEKTGLRLRLVKR